MPRSRAHPPRAMTRWNYWDSPWVQPDYPWIATGCDVDTAPSPSPLQEDLRATSAAIRDRFICRVGGRANSRDEVLKALVYWKRSDPLFENSADAADILKKLKLTQDERLRFRQEARPAYKSTRDLARRIAADQLIYEALREGAPTQDVARDRGLDERTIRRIGEGYQRKAEALRGRSELRGPSTTPPGELLEAARRFGFDVDGDHLVLGDAVCGSNEDVLHWFAHALRNLVRWLDGHPPLPWPARCARACRRHRERLPSRAREVPDS